MKTSLFVIATVTVGLVIAVATGGLPVGSAPAQQPEASTAPAPLALYRRIPMPGVIGRLDHIGADTKRGGLIIAALGNDTAEIVDVNGMSFTMSQVSLAISPARPGRHGAQPGDALTRPLMEKRQVENQAEGK
jgi:hypothetical protein